MSTAICLTQSLRGREGSRQAVMAFI